MAKDNRGLLVLALVSTVIVVSIIAGFLSSQTSGYGTYRVNFDDHYRSNKYSQIVQDSSGAMFECGTWPELKHNGFGWKATYLNGYVEVRDSNWVGYGSTGINCEQSQWDCGDKAIPCDKDYKGVVCTCGSISGVNRPGDYMTDISTDDTAGYAKK